MEFISNTLIGFDRVKSILEGLGVKLTQSSDGKVYPMSREAKSVVDILLYEALNLKVEILYNQDVKTVLKNRDFIIQTSTNSLKSSKLIIASGSSAYPQLGASNIGLDIAFSFNHNIISTTPSLVQLTTPNPIKLLSGYRQKAKVKLISNGTTIQEVSGDVLFTSYGVSGLAILDISYLVAKGLNNYEYIELSINLLGELKNLKVDRSSLKPSKLWLSGYINQKLAQIILSQNSLLDKKEQDINSKDIKKIIYSLKNFRLEIDGTRGEKGAEVMAGGVDTRELNYNMSSKLVKNLYFIGEVVDVVGDRGGYNLHWAWSSALRLVDI